MPIPVLCPGCKARFNVSDQFAGKKGPCPKCKSIITIPAAPPPQMKEEVKIHVPEEFAAGGKDVKGRAITKPIARQEVKVKKWQVAAIVGAVVVVFAVAWLARGMNDSNKRGMAVLGLMLISAPLAAAGYTFLRDDELEPYRGRSLWIRTAICAVVYATLWGVYWPVSHYMTGELWQWLFVAPIFICLGALTAYSCFDLDFGAAALHYTFFLLVTLALGWAMDFTPIKTDKTNSPRRTPNFAGLPPLVDLCQPCATFLK